MAEVGPQRRTVGSIGGGVHLRTTATADADFVAVQFPDGAASAVTPLKGTRLLVRRADVRAAPDSLRRLEPSCEGLAFHSVRLFTLDAVRQRAAPENGSCVSGLFLWLFVACAVAVVGMRR